MPTLLETAQRTGSFKTLVKAVQTAGLEQTLAGPGPITLFAPTDQAFAKLPPETVEELFRESPKLRDFLSNHIVQGRLLEADVARTPSVRTMRGATIAVVRGPEGLRVGPAKVLESNLMADNGVLHSVDAVIMPAQEQATSAPPKREPEAPTR